MTQVSISHLNKIYPGATAKAVDDLNLEIESGELYALLGPSGCGKTTTMKMIAGLLEPTSGDVLFNGVSQNPIPPEKRGAVMVFQNYLLFPYMSVGENVGFGLKMRGVDKETIQKKVAEMLELVQLPGVEDRRPKQLSGGQQQRIALARALIVQPNVLLLDEPLSNLDAHLRDEMRELIRSIQKDTQITMLFVTHDQEEAVILADKIALMFDGVLHQNDTPNKFYEQPATEQIARFFGGLNFLPGKLDGGQFDSSIGRFSVPQGVINSGEALMSIRPESIEMGAADGAANIAKGRIISHVYMGTHSRYKVMVKGELFQVVADPQSIRHFKEGDEVNLRFAPEKVWALPK